MPNGAHFLRTSLVPLRSPNRVLRVVSIVPPSMIKETIEYINLELEALELRQTINLQSIKFLQGYTKTSGVHDDTRHKILDLRRNNEQAKDEYDILKMKLEVLKLKDVIYE